MISLLLLFFVSGRDVNDSDNGITAGILVYERGGAAYQHRKKIISRMTNSLPRKATAPHSAF
jgi:hypothetical protein